MRMTDEDGKYNGWANRETWALNLHLTNNEGDYLHYMSEARRIKRAAVGESAAVGELAGLLKDEMDDVRFRVFDAAKKSGLVTAEAVLLLQDMCDFDGVDWHEVAQAFIDEVKAEHKTPFRKNDN
jgi:hypothetical protein